MIDLSGKRAIVCGSTQGIGRACAIVLAKQGAAVTLVARDEAALHEVCAQLSTGAGQQHDCVCTDFTEPSVVRDKVGESINASGPVDILVNNTGGPPSGPIYEAEPEAFLRALAMHVVCNQHLAQLVISGMKKKGYGRIINIISTSVKEPIPGLGISNTTRAAVAAWGKTLSREVAPFGITVNNVLPGYTDTARLRELFENKAKRTGASAEEVAEASKNNIPAGRFASAEEIANAVAFLASPEASYVNGINLPVDGGRLASH